MADSIRQTQRLKGANWAASAVNSAYNNLWMPILGDVDRNRAMVFISDDTPSTGQNPCSSFEQYTGQNITVVQLLIGQEAGEAYECPGVYTRKYDSMADTLVVLETQFNEVICFTSVWFQTVIFIVSNTVLFSTRTLRNFDFNTTFYIIQSLLLFLNFPVASMTKFLSHIIGNH